jgi:hypothetical protein
MIIIDEFRGDWEFCSNFSDHPFTDKYNVEWKTVEHYYQAAKTPHPLLKMLIWDAEFPGQAKKLPSQPDNEKYLYPKEVWLKINKKIMWSALAMKFTQHLDIKEKLVSTNGIELIEGNKWHDNYWGDCTCSRCIKIVGQNMLGKMLMQIRKFDHVK